MVRNRASTACTTSLVRKVSHWDPGSGPSAHSVAGDLPDHVPGGMIASIGCSRPAAIAASSVGAMWKALTYAVYPVPGMPCRR
jgi:hypothetical protein